MPIEDPTPEHVFWEPLSEDKDKALLMSVKDLLQTSAGGPSQLSPVHLKEACFCGAPEVGLFGNLPMVIYLGNLR